MKKALITSSFILSCAFCFLWGRAYEVADINYRMIQAKKEKESQSQ